MITSFVQNRRAITIITLRRKHRDWSWTYERAAGGDRHYIGMKGHQRVELYPVSIVCGPNEDDYETDWRAEVSGQINSMTYTEWCQWSKR